MGRAVYTTVKSFIIEQIRSGAWKQGQKVPSEPELARQFGVARMTVNRALRDLTTEEVLTRIQGVGTYVADAKCEFTRVDILSISEEIVARGHRYRAKVIEVDSIYADAKRASEMSMVAGSPLFYSRVLHFENDVAVQLEERWVNPVVAPHYAQQDFTTTTPGQYLLRVAPLERVQYRIEALTPCRDIRSSLQMGEAEASLVLRRRTWSRGSVATTVVLWHPGSRYRLSGNFESHSKLIVDGKGGSPVPEVRYRG